MFGRKERKALEALPPLHRQLVEQKQLSQSLTPPQWVDLLTSIQTNQQTVHRHPLPPRTAEVVLPLLRILLEDVPDDGFLGVRLDLTGSDAAGKAGPEQSLPVAKPVRKCLQHYEFDPWFSAEAKLNDKSKLDVWIADVVRVRRITKRSTSGKIKTKTKKKISQRLRVQLSVPGDRVVAAPAKGEPAWCRITMERDDRHTVLDGRAKYPVVGPPNNQLNNVLLLVGEVFRWVPPARPERSSA
jgi:hypothetical protein